MRVYSIGKGKWGSVVWRQEGHVHGFKTVPMDSSLSPDSFMMFTFFKKGKYYTSRVIFIFKNAFEFKKTH